jgi:hypothetical protein
MIGEDIILPLTIPTGDVHPLSQLLLPTIYTRTRQNEDRASTCEASISCLSPTEAQSSNICYALADSSHHLWVFSTAFGEAVPKTQRFYTHRPPRTQPAVGVAFSDEWQSANVQLEPPQEHGSSIVRRRELPPWGSAIPKTPPDFARPCRTVRYSTRMTGRPYAFPYGRAAHG